MKKPIFFPLASFLCLVLLSACSQNQVPTSDLSTETENVTPTSQVEVSATSESTSLVASFPPPDGCEWVNFDASAVNLKLLTQKCSQSKSIFEVKDEAVHYASPDSTDSWKVLEVFHKKADETAQQALTAQFISKLSTEEQAGCQVTPTPGKKMKSGEMAYNLTPNEEYQKVLEAKSDGPIESCGEYGSTNGLQYFLFKDQNPEMFVFVRIGQDLPPFDEENIQFLK